MMKISITHVMTLIVTATAVVSSESCPEFKHHGCYNSLGGKNKVLKNLLVDGREKGSPYEIKWSHYNTTLARLICHCAELATSQNYKTFGTQFYGECWASKKTAEEINSLLTPVKYCVNGRFRTCENEFPCSGIDSTTALFETGAHKETIIDGGYSDWGNWSICSATCGNGTHIRKRTCTNPVPSSKGKGCESLGPSQETEECVLGLCPIVPTDICTVIDDDEEYYGRIITGTRNSERIREPFCKTKLSGSDDDESYKLKANMKSETKNAGMGFYFNAQDEENYEYAYVLVEHEHYCYTTGKVRNAKNMRGSQTEKMCEHTFKAKTNVHLELQVIDGQVIFKADDHQLASYKMKTNSISNGGVLVKIINDESEVLIEDFSISEIDD